MSTSIFLPLTPPLALISSTAIPYAFLNLSPNGASGPVMGCGAPILSVSCAMAGAAATTRSIPDTRLRTRNRRMVSVSLHVDGVMGLADCRIASQALSRPRIHRGRPPSACLRRQRAGSDHSSELVANEMRAFDESPKLSPCRLPAARHQAAIRAGVHVGSAF